MRKFTNIANLLAFWETMEGTALLYEENGRLSRLSYQALREAVLREADKILKEDHFGTSASGHQARPLPSHCVHLLRMTQTPETIIRLFALLYRGEDLLLVDPLFPEAVAQKTLEAVQADQAQENAQVNRVQENLSGSRILFYTSGTSAQSRCVILTARSLLGSAWSGQSMLPCGPEDVILDLMPLAHVFGFVCSLLWGLCYGAAVALGRGMRHIAEDCCYFHPTILPAVPSVAAMLDRFGLFNPELQILLLGAAPCPKPLWQKLSARGIQVYLGYGLTETSSGVAITQDLDEPDALYLCPRVKIRVGGRIIEGMSDTGTQEKGYASFPGAKESDQEIAIATPCMMEGYLGEPSPLANGWLNTGDLGHIDAKGRLHLAGRKKDVLILADGQKIFCPEYEMLLAQAFGTDQLAVALRGGKAVLVIEAEAADTLLEKARQLAAAHAQRQARPGQTADPVQFQPPHIDLPDPVDLTDVSAFLLRTLHRFNATRPRSQQLSDIVLLTEKLPRTPIGKLQRWKLDEMINVSRGQVP